MRQHERITARLAWHAARMKELMDQGISLVAASTQAYGDLTQLKPRDLERWWEQHKSSASEAA